MLECLKDWSRWDPEAAEEFNNNVYQLLADEAGVDLKTFHSAKGIVNWDGWYGPYSDEEYAEEGHKITKARALEIIEAARQYRFNDIEFYHPDYETGCSKPEDHINECDCCENNCTISGSVIYDEVWKWYRKIYG